MRWQHGGCKFRHVLQMGCKSHNRQPTQHRCEVVEKTKPFTPGVSSSLSWSRNGEKTGSVNFRMEENKMILNYRHKPRDGEWEGVEQVVSIDRTPCNFGGCRKWFLCPHCGKRVAILYGAGKYFFCRHCCRLTYYSCNVFPLQRISDKADKLHKNLGAESGGFMDFIPQRPLGMHRSTDNRIIAEIERLENIVNSASYNEFRVRL